MNILKKMVSKILPPGIKRFLEQYIIDPGKIRGYYKHVEINPPVTVAPRFVEIEEFTRIQPQVKLITCEAKFIVKKYSAIGSGCLIVPGAHTPTVGLPQFLSTLHINDVQRGITVNEDCWVGAEAALLSKCDIGRGAIVAARSVVTKDVPPYAVVAGMPAKIIATRFTLEQVLEHERILYPPEERLDEEFLKELFETKYKDLKAIGTDEITASDQTLLDQTKLKFGMYPYNK